MKIKWKTEIEVIVVQEVLWEALFKSVSSYVMSIL